VPNRRRSRVSSQSLLSTLVFAGGLVLSTIPSKIDHHRSACLDCQGHLERDSNRSKHHWKVVIARSEATKQSSAAAGRVLLDRFAPLAKTASNKRQADLIGFRYKSFVVVTKTWMAGLGLAKLESEKCLRLY